MVDVAFKDLCIDVTAGHGRPAAVAQFWAHALDLEIGPAGGEDSVLKPFPGDHEERTVWVNAVPEPIAGKSRVHLDLALPGGDPKALINAGARVLRGAEGSRHWHVLEDPDGVAFCVFDSAEVGSGRSGVYELVVDADDPTAIATWWAERTGATVHHHPERPFVWLEGVAGLPYDRWEFNPVPEPKAHKNRLHWDVTLQDASVDDLVHAGAHVIQEATKEAGWTVLADPEGNEFCAFVPKGS